MSDYPTLPLDDAAMARFNAHLAAPLTEPNEVLYVLTIHQLQMKKRNGKWYDVRKNGMIRNNWKRNPDRISVPCKIGMRDCFRLDYDPKYYADGFTVFGDPVSLRVRPPTFNIRTRE